MGNVVHRVVEQQAARRPDAIAVSDVRRAMTYRELNQRANALARRLNESGLTRGALAFVRLPRSTDLAIVLLAVLKAGAAYAWIEPGAPEDLELPASFCFTRRGRGDEDPYILLDIMRALRDVDGKPSPNLPVLTRESDVACVLPGAHGRPHVLVPHATIAALRQLSSGVRAGQGGDTSGAFDLWLGLMSGAALALGTSPAAAA